MDAKERYSRQSSLVPDEITNLPITIVGVGAIGRNVALMLVSMGAENITIFDFDKVEESNIASQGFLESQIGMSKVDAVKQSAEFINSEIEIKTNDMKFIKSCPVEEVVFSCVDSMDARKMVCNTVKRKERTSLFVDGRMAGETARVLGFDPRDKDQLEKYMSTILPDEQAYSGSCTAKSTIYCSNIISGFMVNMLTKKMRDIESDRDYMINIMANEIFLNE